MTNPLFPSGGPELAAFGEVVRLTCADTQSTYEQEKAKRRSIYVSDVVGKPERTCAVTTLLQVTEGECADLFKDFIQCREYNEYTHARKCKDIRVTLQKCVVKNKMGELGQNFSM